jgi:hypothetical protein
MSIAHGATRRREIIFRRQRACSATNTSTIARSKKRKKETNRLHKFTSIQTVKMDLKENRLQATGKNLQDENISQLCHSKFQAETKAARVKFYNFYRSLTSEIKTRWTVNASKIKDSVSKTNFRRNFIKYFDKSSDGSMRANSESVSLSPNQMLHAKKAD